MKNKTLLTILTILIVSLFMLGCKDKGNKKYNVKLMVDGELYQTIEVAEGETISATSFPKVEKELHNFVGWNDEQGNLFTTEMTITSDKTFTAEFEKQPTVILTINYNNMFEKEYEVLSWTQIKLEDYILPIDEYQFASWKINGSSYAKEFIVLDSDLTIEAIYTEAPKPATLSNDYFTHGKIKVVGPDLVDKNGKKFQLIGLSTHGLQWFSRYVNPATISSLKNTFGINVIRLAMYTSEDGYCTSEANKERLYNLVVQGVKYATQAGLYVIVDWHMVGAEDPNDKNPLYYKEEAMEFFGKISKEFKDYDNVLYEIMNEPNGSTSWNQCKTYAEAVIPKIRENTDAIILVGNPNWTANLNAVIANPLVGYENIMYTYHFYAADHKNTYQVSNAYDKGFPVFISEHGGMDSSGDGAMNITSIQNWYKVLDQRNISYVAWNISNSKGSASIIKHGDDTLTDFSDEHLKEWGIWYKKWTRAKAGLK